MPLVRDLSSAQLSFRITGSDDDRFLVLRYRGTEGLCQLYRFDIELASSGPADLDQVVGQAAVLSINTAEGPRWFHGIVNQFEVTGESADQVFFRAQLVPKVWLLNQRYDARIFQDRTVPQIIEDVLTGAGLAGDAYTLERLTRAYAPRIYCVQYRESDYTFICRLMEHEGIRWYFQQEQERHVLVLEDGDNSSYAPIEGGEDIVFRSPTGLKTEQEHVSSFRLAQSVRPQMVTLTDFDFESPGRKLAGRSHTAASEGLEFYDHPGQFTEQRAGDKLAALREQEFQASSVRGVGGATSGRLAPGKTFRLAEHAGGLNGRYLVTSLTHEGKQATSRATTGLNGRARLLNGAFPDSVLAARDNGAEGIRLLAQSVLQILARLDGPQDSGTLTNWPYHGGQVTQAQGSIAAANGRHPLEALLSPNSLDNGLGVGAPADDQPIYVCRFECIPADVLYRPPRVTAWPQIRGSQTARIVGPETEEIYTDEYGRVKVQFHWDRLGKFDEKSSCWIRVSQGMAGGAYGAMFLPRVGQEVVVDFLEGNPDEPLIVGRVYNGDHPPPYPLPEEKTKSCIKTHSTKGGGGTNEIRFEDLAGREELLIQAENSLNIHTKGTRKESTGSDRHLTVGRDKLELVKRSRHTKVLDSVYEEIGTNEYRKLGNARVEEIGGSKWLQVKDFVVEHLGSHDHSVKNAYRCEASIIRVQAANSLELQCGASRILLTPTAMYLEAPAINLNSGYPKTGVAPIPGWPQPEMVLPEPAGGAPSTKPGRDVRYEASGQRIVGQTPEDIQGRRTTWIAVELMDESGQPVPGERFAVLAPDGTTVITGATDKNGQAMVEVPTDGVCQISFVDLDQTVWEERA